MGRAAWMGGLVGLLLTGPATAQAPASAVSMTCAKALPADSRMIYDATVKNMKGLDTIRETVVAQTRAMVMSGKISQANARPAAEAAGTCLKLLASS
jgi:hypothetical protein